MNCKRVIYIIFFIFLMASAVGASSSRKTFTPFGRPKTIKFDSGNGKTYTYYCLVKGKSMGFAVEGPVKVDVRSRAGLPGQNVIAEYQIQVWEGEYLVKADKFRTKYVEAKFIDSDLVPAAYRNTQFDVPLGIHNYRLWLVSDNIDTVLIRLYKSIPTEGEPVKVIMRPLEYNRKVHLYSKKNQTPYYLIDRQSGLKLKVTGPIELIIRARANFTEDMDGRIGYTISVYEGQKEIETLSATTSKSLTMAYQDYTGVVPSRPTQFIIKVPEGTHIYNFLLKKSAAETVSIRFSLPKQD
ncbi:MAG: hypothetical protein B6D58_04060 [candidate division Zixibacteria bacterium 4484_95]|nr:MAG: hypothetical protein B6D58_04060 [candidate division Zixibacteria bacterium 4484_95]